jgi:hypothetical protein
MAGAAQASAQRGRVAALFDGEGVKRSIPWIDRSPNKADVLASMRLPIGAPGEAALDQPLSQSAAITLRKPHHGLGHDATSPYQKLFPSTPVLHWTPLDVCR